MDDFDTGESAEIAVKPLRRDAEENRDRILRSAQELFARRGLDTTLDDIADHAQVGVGTVYRRFPNKESLVDALFERRIQEMVEVAQGALSQENPWTGFVALLEGFLALEAEDRGLREVVLGSSFGKDRVARAKERIKPLVDEVIGRAQGDGSLRHDLRSTDIAMITAMAGAVGEFCDGVASGLWRRYLLILLDGLMTSRETPSHLDVQALDAEQLNSAMRGWRT